MKQSRHERLVQRLLDYAGVQINGSRPFDIHVHKPDFYPRVLAGGSLALGESYMDGWWDCERLDRFFERITAARLDKIVRKSTAVLLASLRSRLTNTQGIARAFEIGRHHYDTGNDLFEAMLDKRMNYSCGYWKNADNLDAAQEAKLELACRKLMLSPGMRVLDIGCGWGAFAAYAARQYGVEVTGVTVSREQVDGARQCCEGLPVCIELQDYRQIQGIFDRVVSIGMFEHVGASKYRTYMQVVQRCLTDDGLFLLHTIGSNSTVETVDPWIAKYIFPNSLLPSARLITASAEGLFVLEDWHSFGTHYDRTLMAWYRNFTRNWHRLSRKYSQRFYRMWTYYLLCSAGTFRSRRNQLWQVVFSKNGLRGGYARFR